MKYQILNIKDKISNPENLVKILLKNRGVRTKKEIEEFLHPKLESVTADSVGIDKKQLKKAIARIELAIKNKEQIVVYGDYDVDGICGTAILWETLNSLGAKVTPYIPHRIDEGYGLSTKGIQNVQNKYKNVKLIITVDNGIVANRAVDFANEQGIDVIITDHHVPSAKLPSALAIVHTTKLCGTGVAYLLAKEISNFKFQISNKSQILNTKYLIRNTFLELVALATVADLVPLKGANRTLLKFGLEALGKTKRIGLLELFKEAGIDQSKIGVYEIGHIIAPRLNATGRLDYAMDSLRLICTTNPKRAEKLAKEIGATNKERQEITLQATLHAIEQVKKSHLRQGSGGQAKIKNLLFITHESYEQGVIGLVAGKLVEEFYRPAIVISKGKKYSKASARSIKGFNIIEFIRTASEFLVDAGGHPMAAGFTVETEKIPMLEKLINKKIERLLDEEILTRKLRIDCELPLSFIDVSSYSALQELSPFGMGNPEPTFLSKVIIEDMRLVGTEGKHIKFKLKTQNSKLKSDWMEFDGIAFNMGERTKEFHIGDKADIVYTIDKDEWSARQSNLPDSASRGKAGAQAFAGGNGNEKLQLKIKDIR